MKKFISQLKQEMLKRGVFATKIVLCSIFSLMVIVLLVSLFSKNGMEQLETVYKECHIGKKQYKVVIKNDGYFRCDNCSKKLKKKVIAEVDWADLNGSSMKLSEYFVKHNGVCDYSGVKVSYQ